MLLLVEVDAHKAMLAVERVLARQKEIHEDYPCIDTLQTIKELKVIHTLLCTEDATKVFLDHEMWQRLFYQKATEIKK